MFQKKKSVTWQQRPSSIIKLILYIIEAFSFLVITYPSNEIGTYFTIPIDYIFTAFMETSTVVSMLYLPPPPPPAPHLLREKLFQEHYLPPQQVFLKQFPIGSNCGFHNSWKQKYSCVYVVLKNPFACKLSR